MPHFHSNFAIETAGNTFISHILCSQILYIEWKETISLYKKLLHKCLLLEYISHFPKGICFHKCKASVYLFVLVIDLYWLIMAMFCIEVSFKQVLD